MAKATLTISSKNYSSWSLRGWLLARFSGLEFAETMVSPDDADARRELLLLAPSIRVPCLTHDGARVWNTMAIAYNSVYKGWPGDSAAPTSLSQTILSLWPNQPAAVAGNRMMEEAKIGGITPDMFNFNGRCEAWPPYNLLPTWRLA